MIGNSTQGSGPYALPADWLRMKDDKAAFWVLLGVVYQMIPCDLSEFDMLVQQTDIQAYPYIIATDSSPGDAVQQQLPAGTTAAFYVYSPPSGNYPYTVRYYSQMADVASAESSATVPWFPNQGYLRKKTTAGLMELTGDSRQAQFNEEADAILREYLALRDNKSNRAQSVKLDRRRFGRSFSTLPNTKTVGW